MRLEHQPSGTAISTATQMDGLPPASLAHGTDRYWARWLGRCVWMAVLCGLIGAGSTYAWIRSQPPTFRTAALFQIEGHGTQSTMGEDQASFSSSLGDEVFVVRGEQVLRDAIRRGELESCEPFAGMRFEEIASRLGSSPLLVVEPADKQRSTNVIRIQYDSSSPSASKRVVQGIMDAYMHRTQENFKKGDDEALARIIASREKALNDLQEIERQHDAFLKQTELVFVEDEPQSVHRKIADRFLTQREELMIERAEIESRIRAAEVSRNESDPRTMMLTLKADEETASDAIDQNISRQLERLQSELRDRASVRTRETELLPLELEREKMLQRFGRLHPKVVEIQTQIDVAEKKIARMKSDEDEKEVMIKKIMTLGRKSDVELDPEAELRARVELAIKALKQQLKSLDQQLSSVNASYEEESAAAKAEIEAIRESQRFEREIERQQELYETILTRLDEVNLLSEDQGTLVSILESPREGIEVALPIQTRCMTGGLIGLVAGMLLAMMLPPRQREAPAHVQSEQRLATPVLGHVPLIPAPETSPTPVGALEHNPLDAKLSTVSAPYGRAAESFNAIRATLFSASAARDDRIIQVTSAYPNIGRSTVTANLAVSAARAGKKVLLIDADLRRPKMQELFGLAKTHGLGWILEELTSSFGRKEVADRVETAIQKGPVAGLSIIAAGTSRENPSELLSSKKITLLYETLREMFDLILVDTPPMDMVSDSRDLAPKADAVALVIRSGPAEIEHATSATETLTQLNANVVGVIINGVSENGDEGVEYRLHPASQGLRLHSEKNAEGAPHS